MTDPLRSYVQPRYELRRNVPYFGLELEVENASIPAAICDSQWHTVEDGSLRNGGMEFLSARPMTVDEVTDNVEMFYEWMNEYNYATSVRTSTHVHVNVLDFDLAQIAAMCTVYALVEPLLFRYCGPLREENIYCVPWYRATDELDFVRVLGEGALNVREACKYSALYLEPLRRFGTLEFRQAPVFAESAMLLDWVDMCHSIVYSGYDTPADVLSAYSSMHPDEFIERVFGPYLTPVLRKACDMDMAELLEEYDVYSTAELALACTYNPTEWFTPQVIEAEGDGTTGYRLNCPRQMNIRPEWDEDLLSILGARRMSEVETGAQARAYHVIPPEQDPEFYEDYPEYPDEEPYTEE